MTPSSLVGKPTAPTLRSALPGDLEFLWALHVAAMKPYVEAMFGWNEADQRAMYEHEFATARNQIIELDGQAVGRLELRDEADAVWLGNIQVMPAHQNLGLGSSLIRAVMTQAFAGGRPVRLRALRINPARKLYARLGFAATQETETHVYMEALP